MNTMSYKTMTITLDAAQKLLSSAISFAESKGWNIAVVVLDPAGFTVASARMDGVSAAILEIATDKAYTATLGKSSASYSDRMNSSPELTLGAANRPRFCAWEGGLPLYQSGMLVGAIGVSGASGLEDAECGQQACRSVGFDNVSTEQD
ncbi:MAG: heme-binding protein [Rhizobiaceae bacterium]